MTSAPIVWIIDTSIFLNVLDVPEFNQDKRQVLSEFEERIQNNDAFLLPYAAIMETGNHIARLAGNHKYTYSEKFVRQTKLALNGNAPWKPIRLPTLESINRWLDQFPDHAGHGRGFADFSIVKEWEEQSGLLLAYSVRIWSLDVHLAGYQS